MTKFEKNKKTYGASFSQTWDRASLCDETQVLSNKGPLNSEKRDTWFFLIKITL